MLQTTDLRDNTDLESKSISKEIIVSIGHFVKFITSPKRLKCII